MGLTRGRTVGEKYYRNIFTDCSIGRYLLFPSIYVLLHYYYHFSYPHFISWPSFPSYFLPSDCDFILPSGASCFPFIPYHLWVIMINIKCPEMMMDLLHFVAVKYEMITYEQPQSLNLLTIYDRGWWQK